MGITCFGNVASFFFMIFEWEETASWLIEDMNHNVDISSSKSASLSSHMTSPQFALSVSSSLFRNYNVALIKVCAVLLRLSILFQMANCVCVFASNLAKSLPLLEVLQEHGEFSLSQAFHSQNSRMRCELACCWSSLPCLVLRMINYCSLFVKCVVWGRAYSWKRAGAVGVWSTVCTKSMGQVGICASAEHIQGSTCCICTMKNKTTLC